MAGLVKRIVVVRLCGIQAVAVFLFADDAAGIFLFNLSKVLIPLRQLLFQFLGDEGVHGHAVDHLLPVLGHIVQRVLAAVGKVVERLHEVLDDILCGGSRHAFLHGLDGLLHVASERGMLLQQFAEVTVHSRPQARVVRLDPVELLTGERQHVLHRVEGHISKPGLTQALLDGLVHVLPVDAAFQPRGYFHVHALVERTLVVLTVALVRPLPHTVPHGMRAVGDSKHLLGQYLGLLLLGFQQAYDFIRRGLGFLAP